MLGDFLFHDFFPGFSLNPQGHFALAREAGESADRRAIVWLRAAA
jgi:hypothetical protein